MAETFTRPAPFADSHLVGATTRLATVLGWSGCVSGLLGAATLAAHQPWSGFGFVLFLFSNVCWFVHARATRVPALMLMHVGYTLTALAGIWNWLF